MSSHVKSLEVMPVVSGQVSHVNRRCQLQISQKTSRRRSGVPHQLASAQLIPGAVSVDLVQFIGDWM